MKLARLSIILIAFIVLGSFKPIMPKWLPGSIENPNLNELSGLSPSWKNNGKYWGHNDSMNSPHIFLLSSDGKNYGQIAIVGALNFDWEAIQTGKCAFSDACIFIGDIGDNYKFRDTIRIEILPEPLMGAKKAKISQTLILSYPDGTHNAESLLISKDGRSLYILEKLDWENRKQNIRIYAAKIPNSKERFLKIKLTQNLKILNNQAKTPIGSITDASFANENEMFFRDYRNIYRIGNFKGNGEKLTPSLFPSTRIKQSEALTISHDGAHLLVGSEGKNSKLFLLPIKKAK